MARTLRFHLDEHVSHAIADGLRRLGINVTTTTDAGLLRAPDTSQLAFAVSEERIVSTQDRGFLVMAAIQPHLGIAFCKQNSRSIGDIIRGLELIWEIYEPEDMRN